MKGKKVLHAYLGKEVSEDLKKKLKEREALRLELKKIQDVLLASLSAKIKDII